jgi:hypothetical protein
LKGQGWLRIGNFWEDPENTGLYLNTKTAYSTLCDRMGYENKWDESLSFKEEFTGYDG